ncbi:MAG: DAK2 domain-containing protein [Clostridiales bacterium]|nr:DAK2 domain-containing protein [Clostridiales bacterium]MBS5877471.1 DAK2 domain-containing protein [Clostridiales bacterium]MDU0938858.1 DAK2 domain-containing protein [Clostridiales bacterium]MDU1041502.1 DAK2 domain-containing protein [Clostridiales bacterium]MDU3490824.1 DAK2 domain-containing protein [Clostridiales bacterium]
MAMNTINAEMVRKMFLAGARKLESQKERINDLNVFPVPDGDTGTNMTLTVMSAADELEKIQEPTMAGIAKAISSGSLRGARGNSGVIFSQLCRGFLKEVGEHETIDVALIAKATQRASETAYKAVMKPKEGTILTVAKGIAEISRELASKTDDIETALELIIKHAEYVLSKTPDMLPVLKEAGVVDSGGQGLVCVLHGFMDALTGKVSDFEVEGKANIYTGEAQDEKGAQAEDVEIKFGYCTEFIIKLDNAFTETDEMEFKEFLTEMGDSIVCVALDDIVKVHVHTNHPGTVFERGLTYGQLTRMKVDNMREEHENKLVTDSEINAYEAAETVKKEEPAKETAFLAVAPGEGIAGIFRDMGADGVIEGGQTMNPSTSDILDAAEKINAKNIFVLPNNSNIILAANQAADLIEGKKIIVIPSKTIPQGVAAVVAFDPTAEPEVNEENMADAINYVRSGQVTYAVRDTTIDGREVKKGNYIAITDKGLSAVAENIKDSVMEMLESMVTDESELISIYYGTDVTEADAEAIAAEVTEKYPDFEIELQNGGQPVYYYIVSVE